MAQQCKENIYAIQTLKDFQYLDDNKDQGINVREKAKALVALLKDDERLRNERVRALKAKERFAQSAAGIGSDTVVSSILPETVVSSIFHISLFRNKRFALNKMFQRTVSKFAIFYV